MNYIKVKDKNFLERDVLSNGIVNTDIENYEKYVETYKERYNEKQKIKKLESDMDSIKGDLNEIKMLLSQVCKNESK